MSVIMISGCGTPGTTSPEGDSADAPPAVVPEQSPGPARAEPEPARPEDLTLEPGRDAAIGRPRWYDSGQEGVLPVLAFDYLWREDPRDLEALRLEVTVVNGANRNPQIPERMPMGLENRIDTAELDHSGTLYFGSTFHLSSMKGLELHLESGGGQISNTLFIEVPGGEYSTLPTAGVLPDGARTIGP